MNEVCPVPPLATVSVPVVPATIGRFVASVRSNAGVASEPPSETDTPPYETEELVRPELFRVPENDGVKVKVPPEFVTEFPRVSPLNDWVEVASVTAPVCAEPNECWMDDTPLLIDEVATQLGTPFTSAST